MCGDFLRPIRDPLLTGPADGYQVQRRVDPFGGCRSAGGVAEVEADGASVAGGSALY
ncbi:hypothetical protein Shyhy01_15310 [Streptomyces hygroscopicus subsp. hygroscopicus]|nr:hypothetical protein Shyhy01_15310 [Streptomyces hygroscopicus subsp. hygroscopicus]